MELKEFVRSAINSIREAVQEANDSSDYQVSFATGSVTVEFDIAVEESKSSDKKGGIEVVSIVSIGGNTSKEVKNSTVSRMKFGVFISNETESKKIEKRNNFLSKN